MRVVGRLQKMLAWISAMCQLSLPFSLFQICSADLVTSFRVDELQRLWQILRTDLLNEQMSLLTGDEIAVLIVDTDDGRFLRSADDPCTGGSKSRDLGWNLRTVRPKAFDVPVMLHNLEVGLELFLARDANSKILQLLNMVEID